jgi:RNA polymerase sigma factor (sigma-70 family)
VTPIISTAILRTQSDERLVALAQAGHERAFEALIERYRKALLRHVRRYLPEARAEDALQQAFLNAWSALERGVAVREPRAWLYRVAQNAALNALRANGYEYAELRESLRSHAAGPEEDHERRWVMRRTLAGLAALPEAQREALLRTAVEGRSHDQVAAELGLSEGAVRGLVYRARTTLRAAAAAVTPAPLVSWAVAFASTGDPSGGTGERIAQIAAGGGTASAGAVLAKAGAVVAVTSVLAGGAVAVRDEAGAGSGSGNAQADAIKHGLQPGGLGRLAPGAAGPALAGGPGAGPAGAREPREHGRGDEGRGHGRGRGEPGNGNGQRSGRGHGRSGRTSTSGTGGAGEDHGSRSGSSGGSGSSGSGGGEGHSGSGSSGSGSSGSGGSGSSGSGSGSSGSGSSGSGDGGGGGGGGEGISGGGSGSSGPGPDGGGGGGGDGSGGGGSDGGGSGSSGPGSSTLTVPATPPATMTTSGSDGGGGGGHDVSGGGDGVHDGGN